MKKVAILFFLLLLAVQLYAVNQITLVKQNYVRILTRFNDASADSILLFRPMVTPSGDKIPKQLKQIPLKVETIDEKAVEAYLNKLQSDGSFADINYKDTKRADWDVARHAERVLELAKLFSVSQKNEQYASRLAVHIHAALGYWIEEMPQSANWWNNEIYIPKTLGQAALLFEQQLTRKEKKAIIKILKKSSFGRTGQNRVWLAGNVLIRALLQEDEELAEEARNEILSELVVTENAEGIQPDWSFRQHGPVQQFGNYGLSFIEDMAMYAQLFEGTSFALSSAQYYTLASLLQEGYRYVMWKGMMDVASIGRTVTKDGQRMAGLNTGLVAQKMAGMKNVACRTAGNKLLEENFLLADSLKPLIGHKHFYKSDYTIHRRPQWMTTVKMASNRVIGTEQVNDYNLYGYYQGDGATYTYIDGNEYLYLFPLWDWRKIPGITCYDTDAPINTNWKDKAFNKTDFAGGLTVGNVGITAMELNRDGLKAHKVWVFTEDYVLCLGTVLSANGATATSIEQQVKQNELLHLNGIQWDTVIGKKTYNGGILRFFHHETGYIVRGNSGCTAVTENRKGKWNDFVKFYAPAVVEGEVMSLYIPHKENYPAAYEYLMIPATTPDKVKAFDNTAVQVLRNDASMQVVKTSNALYIAAFETGEITVNNDIIKVLTPGLYSIANGEIKAVDPTQKLSQLSIGINGQTLYPIAERQ